jgi:hypothetical protein
VSGKVFISYSRDPVRVGQLATTLRQHGLRPWRDAESLGLGAPTRETIRAELADCRAAMIWLTKPTLASDYVTKIEIPEIFQQHVDRGLRIMPVFVDWDPGLEAEEAFRTASGHEIGNHNGHVIHPNDPFEPQLVELASRYARDLLGGLAGPEWRPSLRVATRSNAAPGAASADVNLAWTKEYPADGSLPDLFQVDTLHGALDAVVAEVLHAAEPGPVELLLKCHLHLGLAIGHALRKPTGMVPNVHIADMDWPCVEERYEGHAPLRAHTTPGPITSDRASIEVSVSRDVGPGAQATVAATGLSYHSRLRFQPAGGPGQMALTEPEQNNVWAAQVADGIRDLAASPGTRLLDLYIAAPLQFAVALGWRLNAAGNLRVLHWQDPAGPYVEAWRL